MGMLWGKILGVDLGTSNTRIYEKGRNKDKRVRDGIVLREPTVVAVDSKNFRVLEAGNAAKMMLGKTPGQIQAVRPLEGGVIADFEVAGALLEKFFSGINCVSLFNRPRVVMCIPEGVTAVEKRAVEDAALDAGAKSVALIEEPVAAAIGAGMKIDNPRGCMVVDIGGGTTEAAVISMGGIVVSKTVRIAGNELDKAIIEYLKRKYGVVIGDVTAETLKRNIGSVYPECDSPKGMIVRGLDIAKGLPVTLELGSVEIRNAMFECVAKMAECVRRTLSETPPELSADIYDNGMVLTGGGSLLRGMNKLLAQITQVKVKTADKPLDCVVTGLGRIIENPDRYHGLLNFRSK
jgi:rod shape-determining protein MreB